MNKAAKMGLVGTLIMWSVLAFAHRFHAGITDISFNRNTGNTEIVHTFMAHDVEAMLENRFQRQFDLSDPDDAFVFQQYLEKHFIISNAQGEKLTLVWVGLKLDPDNVMVFQEIEKQSLPVHANIRLSVLTDFLSDQINTLNLNNNSGIQTYLYKRDKQQISIP
jgi:hypothetical protein